MNKAKHNTKTVIVLGAPRSGTSLTSAILNILGVDMGRVSSSVKSNPRGDWEDLDFLKLNKKIISLTEKKSGKTDIPSEKEILDLRSRFEQDIKTLLEEKSKGKKVWGWKDPHTTMTIDLFLPHIHNPYIITVSRDVHYAATSYKRLLEDKVTFEEALELAKEYNRRISSFLARHSELPTISLSFRELTANPKLEVEKITRFLEIPHTNEQEAKIKHFVIPRDRVQTEKKKAKLKRKLLRHLPRSVWRRLTER